MRMTIRAARPALIAIKRVAGFIFALGGVGTKYCGFDGGALSLLREAGGLRPKASSVRGFPQAVQNFVCVFISFPQMGIRFKRDGQTICRVRHIRLTQINMIII